jgi:hypothetical protein
VECGIITQVRHAAATCLSALLDGAANRQYLAIAELRDALPTTTTRRPRARAFTTLSSTLGELCVQVHPVVNPSTAPNDRIRR